MQWSERYFKPASTEIHFESKIDIDINLVKLKIQYYYSNIWGCEILDIPSLRTYNSFKTTFGRENYVAMDMCKYLRSTLAQFRCGILPLRIQTGSYHGEPVEDKLCKLGSNNCVEDEIHFLLHCSLYTDFRSKLFDSLVVT